MISKGVIFVAILLLQLILYGYGTGEMKMNEADIIEKLIADAENDRKSLVWNGQLLDQVNDPMDDYSLIDGYRGEFHYDLLRTPLLRIRIRTDSGLLVNSSIRENNESNFVSENEKRYLSIVCLQEDWENVKKLFDQQILQKEAAPAKADIENILIQEGIIQTSCSRVMVGETAYLSTQQGVVRIIYAGIGNVTEIRLEALEFIKYAAKKLK